MNSATGSSAAGNVRALVASALGILIDEVKDDSSILTLDAWDSMGHMRIILEIEQATGKELHTEQILNIESVTDVSQLLSLLEPVGDG